MRDNESITNLVTFPVSSEPEQEPVLETNSSTESANDRMAIVLRRERQIERLVSRIVNYDDDDEILALTALIHMIAYEKEFTLRDEIAHIAMTKAYTLSIDFSTRSGAFRAKALRLRNKPLKPR